LSSLRRGRLIIKEGNVKVTGFEGGLPRTEKKEKREECLAWRGCAARIETALRAQKRGLVLTSGRIIFQVKSYLQE